MPSINFSQTLGTPKNRVGLASFNVVSSVPFKAILSAKYTEDWKAKVYDLWFSALRITDEPKSYLTCYGHPNVHDLSGDVVEREIRDEHLAIDAHLLGGPAGKSRPRQVVMGEHHALQKTIYHISQPRFQFFGMHVLHLWLSRGTRGVNQGTCVVDCHIFETWYEVSAVLGLSQVHQVLPAKTKSKLAKPFFVRISKIKSCCSTTTREYLSETIKTKP